MHNVGWGCAEILLNYLLFVLKSIMTRNSGLVSGDLRQTGFKDTVVLGVPEERRLMPVKDQFHIGYRVANLVNNPEQAV